jgi:hypothetical protein
MNQQIKKAGTSCVAIAAALCGAATDARADSLQDLKAQVDLLNQKIEQIEQRQRVAPSGPPVAVAAAAAASAVTAGATKGSFKLPGSDTSVTFGGYVKLDAVFSNPSAGVGSTADLELEAPNIPVGPNAKAGERNQVKFGARQSRLFAGTSTPTSWGPLTTYVEGDLYGAAGTESVSNSNGLRVRHAYGTLGGLLAGQTWTTFSDVNAYPETVDFGGPVGTIFARQAQVRWTQPFSGGQWSVALENPETVATLPSGVQFRADDDRLPDLAGIVRFNTALGNYSIAAVARQLRVDSLSAPASRDQKLGSAVGVNGVVPVLRGDDVRFSAYYGNGIGRYSIGFFTDALLDANGHIVLPNQWLATVAYRHFWSPTLRSTLALSELGSSNPAGTAGSDNRNSQSAHLNVIWSPVAQTNLGLEYIYARREVQSGDAGTLNRLQASAQYLF